MDVCITMLVHNRADLTLRCLHALRDRTARPFFLTVVDNASEEPLRDALRRLHSDGFIDSLILHRRNMGVSVAGNAGWAAASHPYYVRMDNDILVRDSGWLDALVERADEGSFGAVAYKFRAWHQTRASFLPSGLAYEATDAVNGGCILVPRRIHERLGFWNEDYLYGWEDLEYGNRIRLVGESLACIQTDSFVEHLGDAADELLPEYREMKRVRTRSTFGADSLFLLNTAMFELNLRPLRVIRKFLPHLGADGITTHTINPEYKAVIARQNLFRKEFLEKHRDGDIHLKMPDSAYSPIK